MFRPMRKTKKEMPLERIEKLISEGEYGVLAVIDTNGYPYSIPVNYVADAKNIYIHCATEGMKIDAILANDKVSFTIVGRHSVVAKRFSSDFESVVCFGKARFIDDEVEKLEILKSFIVKYAPDFQESGFKYASTDHMKTSIIAIEIEHKTGKTTLDL
ncbi:pyridoxamine 5'-phosphate oxidase family protein [Fusibacter bizertensis]|uniref:Pyridoxamine 5'-phosphate oxidase family protein n=1 Tax=Fusibacter bizertensis TaxID=1488331 RepID=A0ABT6NC23_9FIRM|nr:pyridoxamine 5'-phosphate oxidase family protein [Fusibacter bizertensis]MDH8677974.1 pyridoxamine 5'-phosphate oxidase family protein [Fusibacter bizertensis]